MGVAFLPRMTVQAELEAGRLVEVPVRELKVERNICLIHPERWQLSYDARAFLEVVKSREKALSHRGTEPQRKTSVELAG